MKQSHFTLIALLLMIVAFTVATVFYNSGLEQIQNEHYMQDI